MPIKVNKWAHTVGLTVSCINRSIQSTEEVNVYVGVQKLVDTEQRNVSCVPIQATTPPIVVSKVYVLLLSYNSNLYSYSNRFERKILVYLYC